MNMFYTGIGIARSLGEQGIPVIGLTAQHGIYGNFTRYARTVFCPDSRNEPQALLPYLLKLGEELGGHSLIFPTRDDDLVFLDRFRQELERHFVVVVPESSALKACLNKWETFVWAQQTGVLTPRCWLIEEEQDLQRILPDLSYPCVLKPVSAHFWRKASNWEKVGGRKAIGVLSREELLAEYAAIERADQRALVQEMVPGGDDSLVIVACYMDRESKWVAGFNTQKLVQVPEIFGTGCIVQTVNRSELFERTARLLKNMRFNGIAEVEYKWDAEKKEFLLIEINPRPWDQHRLGNACGIDLIYLAYCEHAGLPLPIVSSQVSTHKWIAEDTFVLTALRLLWRRDPRLVSLFRLARGKRIYAIWSRRDPLPFVAYLMTRFIPELISAGVRAVWSAFKTRTLGKTIPVQERSG